MSSGPASPREILQTFVFPYESAADRVSLYARWPDGGVSLADAAGALRVPAGTTVDFSTFFNSFSHRKWGLLTDIDEVRLEVTGNGRARIVIAAIDVHGAALPVAEQIRTLDLYDEPIVVTGIRSIPGAMLSVSVTAQDGDVRLERMAWTTSRPAERRVAVAVVITTFRRERAARQAMGKFVATIIPGSPRADIHLYVVDNGRSLEASQSDRVTLIPNPNLGGAGGFARGLLEARDSGRYTHVLFMDDDADCEPESVWRTAALAAYLKDARAAVSGAMLYTETPTVQHEKGAVFRHSGSFDKFLEALHNGRDLATAGAVASNDGADEANYGAWWFFAFPLAAVRTLPFPFFVRGDDIDFGVANGFPVVTLNGIAAWSGGFDGKRTPATEYLSVRAMLALTLLHGDRRAARRIFRRARRGAVNFGLRLDYASMQAVLEAIEMVARGPRAFAHEPPPLETLGRLNALRSAETMSGADFDGLYTPRPPRGWRALASRMLAGGYLRGRERGERLPYAPIADDMPKWSLLAHDRVAYGAGRDILVMKRSRRRMFALWGRALRLALTLGWQLPRLGRAYKDEADACRSEAYWRARFTADS
ncbi:MAG: glycosyltransferase [Aquamicrobium sp.]|uniref:glycosyltransferase n=1 Tax=Aquamicrobium sp. TaxID=1872579 RepID=UPI00349EA9FD|nr:glycosyltransferase [Aquamicrobium sp.]MCO5158576.1 glycosyltransferase [Aquamicrobium sp.]